MKVLVHPDPNPDIRGYAEDFFQTNYATYIAKKWSVIPEEIDFSVLNRFLLQFSYADVNLDNQHQVLSIHSFTRLFENLLAHPNIRNILRLESLEILHFVDSGLQITDSLCESVG